MKFDYEVFLLSSESIFGGWTLDRPTFALNSAVFPQPPCHTFQPKSSIFVHLFLPVFLFSLLSTSLLPQLSYLPTSHFILLFKIWEYYTWQGAVLTKQHISIGIILSIDLGSAHPRLKWEVKTALFKFPPLAKRCLGCAVLPDARPNFVCLSWVVTVLVTPRYQNPGATRMTSAGPRRHWGQTRGIGSFVVSQGAPS